MTNENSKKHFVSLINKKIEKLADIFNNYTSILDPFADYLALATLLHNRTGILIKTIDAILEKDPPQILSPIIIRRKELVELVDMLGEMLGNCKGDLND